MTRTEVLAHLQAQFGELIAVTGGSFDFAGGSSPVLDQALRALGYGADSLAAADVPDSDTADYLLLAEYYTLVRIVRVLTAKGKSDRLAAATALLAQLRDDLKQRGYLGGGWSMGRLSLDFLEPSETV